VDCIVKFATGDRRRDIAPLSSVTAELRVPMCPPLSEKGVRLRALSDLDATVRCGRHDATAGIELRYVVTIHLLSHGPASISELAEAVAWQGFAVAGRASKSISDALRWEMGYGRVRRLGPETAGVTEPYGKAR
jgi:hypothetical protein